MGSREFLPITYEQWQQEYYNVPWNLEQYSGPIHPSVIYSYIHPMREALGLSSRMDYYQPKRTAVALTTLHHLTPEARHGGLALATWMVKVGKDHPPTRAMGVSIVASALVLQDYLNLPQEAAEYIETTLSEQGIADYQQYAEAASIIRTKIAEVGEEVPLQDWFEGRALATERDHQL